MKFPHNTIYDGEFSRIEDIIWYPYVGKDYGLNERKIVVFGHNATMKKGSTVERQNEIERKHHWANAIDEYTYTPGGWTKAFRSFVRGLAGLGENYCASSPQAVCDKIDPLVREIVFSNFVQGMIRSDEAIAEAHDRHVEVSKNMNKKIIEILKPTHIICWGKHPFNYLCDIPGFECTSYRGLEKIGFASGILDVGGDRSINLLKIHHPCGPKFHSTREETHSILSSFINS